MSVLFLRTIFSSICHCLLDVQMQKKLDANQIQCSQLILENQELKAQCDLLQEKLDNLERNNIRLIQRWTQQVDIFFFSQSIDD